MSSSDPYRLLGPTPRLIDGLDNTHHLINGRYFRSVRNANNSTQLRINVSDRSPSLAGTRMRQRVVLVLLSPSSTFQCRTTTTSIDLRNMHRSDTLDRLVQSFKMRTWYSESNHENILISTSDLAAVHPAASLCMGGERELTEGLQRIW